ncbi:hypothetical protein PRZ48_012108 [Zasmidium cellare]|uniref:Thioester reductase (TE) domain-containing protein n=1 Tax=Zasmidium cellare TaxID=395010 RepID=A0ABR0E3Z6_ZASCE|nr:hypothetical protein PRZ48_012108 [Zasmidium cellare]
MEDALNGHKSVKSAVVVSTGRNQTALLLETSAGDPSDERLIEEVWPLIEQENQECVQTGRLQKDMIIIVGQDKPLPRTAKGSIQKKAAIKLYKKEIDDVYDKVNSPHVTVPVTGTGLDDASSADKAALQSRLLNALALAGMSGVAIHDDLFDKGCDSLGVVSLVRIFNSQQGPGLSQMRLSAKDVYECGSISRMAKRLLGVAEEETGDGRMQRIFDEMQSGLLINARPPVPAKNHGKVVVLTGSTGSLGSYLLDTLLRDETVQEIICLNRSTNSEERQLKSMKDKGLCEDFSTKKTTFLLADFTNPRLGLEVAVYRHLLEKTTDTIHNAWQVDFNVSLEHLAKTHIVGVRELIHLSASSKHNAHIFFISSVGAVSNWKPCPEDKSSAGVPETIIHDWTVAGSVGYSQSKLISERLLAHATTECNIPTTICRVGQIGGPSTGPGCWPKQEWFPSLLLSSKHVGALPTSLSAAQDVIDWTPVNDIAAIISELLHARDSAVYHIVNPRTTTWSHLLPHLETRLGVGNVPLSRWIELVETGEADQNPAFKLLDFFKISTEMLDLWLTQLGL